MDFIKITLLTLLVFQFISCVNETENKIEFKDTLVTELIRKSELNSSKVNGKIIILKTGFCEETDCKQYFEAYQKQIQIYSREDAFMRRIDNYVQILDIDEENRQVILNQRLGKKYEQIELNL